MRKWAKRRGLDDVIINALVRHDFVTLDDVKMIPVDDVNDLFLKSHMLSGKQCILLKKALTSDFMLFDPMSTSPPRGVTIDSRAGSDRDTPHILSLVMDPSSAFIFMTDFYNNSIKVASLESGQLVSTLPLDVAPWSAALIGEKELVVTAPDDKAIILVDVTDKSKLVVRNKIRTGRKYWGVCAVPSTGGDVTLVVGCEKDGDGPDSVDVITIDGTCIKNIINSKKLPKISKPRFVCVHDNHLYISNNSSKFVLKVEVNTGVVVDTLTHPDINTPTQLCIDSAGHLYVASSGGHCVLVRSVDGRWRKLLTGEEHGEREGGCVYPVGLSVSATGLVVSWLGLDDTVVKKYDFV